MANNLFTLGLDITATQNRMSKQLKQIVKNLSDSDIIRVTGGLDTTKSQNLIQQQLNDISKNLKINVGVINLDTSAIKQQQNAINQQLKSGINTASIKVPFQFDLSDTNVIKSEINKIVANITNNKGQLVKYKINVDDNGQVTKALLTYRNELNEVTNATLKLKSVGKWYDANGIEHNIVKWSEGQKSLSQNIEATVKANQRQMESDNQVIRKKQELIAQMQLLNTQAEKAGISLNSDNQKLFNDLSVNVSTLDDIKQLESYLRLARTEYQTFNAEIAKGTHVSSLQAQVKANNSIFTGFFNNLKNGLKDALMNMINYQLAYKIIQETVQALKSMTQAVCDLDKNLTEFNKVADLSYDKLSEFADKAYEAADKIGRTGTDMIEAAIEFKRAGYDLNNSLEMGDAALVMTNVADGITQTSDAASTLISVLNGFNIDEADIMSIVDKMNSVSNQSPVGFDNLADGLERVSGTMNQAGNTIDQTIGLLTGGFTQLRKMEKVATGLTTISQRLRAIDEDGNEIDGLSAKLGEAFGTIGVEIEDANGNLRSTYNILSDYAKVYPELTSEQRQYFGELAAGKHQITVFNAIVDEMGTVDKAIEQSKDILNSATNENEIYRQSIEGMKNELDNQFQMLSKEVISSDWIKDLISAGIDFIEVLTNIIKQDDLVSGTIGIFTDALKTLASVLKNITGNDGMAALINAFMTYKTMTKGIDIFNFFNAKKNSFTQTQSAMEAFFQSAMNGTMQVKDGFVQVGEVEKQLFNSNKNKSGFGRCYVS